MYPKLVSFPVTLNSVTLYLKACRQVLAVHLHSNNFSVLMFVSFKFQHLVLHKENVHRTWRVKLIEREPNETVRMMAERGNVWGQINKLRNKAAVICSRINHHVKITCLNY